MMPEYRMTEQNWAINLQTLFEIANRHPGVLAARLVSEDDLQITGTVMLATDESFVGPLCSATGEYGDGVHIDARLHMRPGEPLTGTLNKRFER
jgi:hypothetical protein